MTNFIQQLSAKLSKFNLKFYDEMGNYLADNLVDACKDADKDATYSRRDMIISDQNGVPILRR